MVGTNAAVRQETQDISTAVLEGCDAFILSDETSIGKSPVESTIQLAKAIVEAENVYDHEQAFQEMRTISKEQGAQSSTIDMLCTTATQISLEDNNVEMFVVLTQTGKTARVLAKQRPLQMILACSTSPQVVRQVNTSRGVTGYKVPAHIKKHQDQLLQLVLKVAKEQGFCYPGNKVMVFTAENEGTLNESVNFKMIEIDEQ
jgi:pyruvate kinase